MIVYGTRSFSGFGTTRARPTRSGKRQAKSLQVSDTMRRYLEVIIPKVVDPKEGKALVKTSKRKMSVLTKRRRSERLIAICSSAPFDHNIAGPGGQSISFLI
jgi:hypothetical protein